MTIFKDQSFDQERALYESNGVQVVACRFEGPADGESALKESRNVEVKDCFFDLRYPFWHDEHLSIEGCELTPNCRAALWYSRDIKIKDTKLHGIKALRECADVSIEGCSIISPEFGWSVRGINMKDSSAEGEYFMMRSEQLNFSDVKLKGKYSFQYITDSVFENCTIIGTQPLCYCKGLKLIGCKMIDTDLSFERSEVEAELTAPIDSIKNPWSGTIKVPAAGEIIMDEPDARGVVEFTA